MNYANVSEVPLALAVFLASDNYDHNSDESTISATTLMKPIRQIVLPRRIPEGEGQVNLADMLNSRMGTAIHDGIERAWLYDHTAALKALGYPNKVIERIKINPKPEDLTPDDIPIYLEQRLSKKVGKWTVTGKFDFIGEGKVQDFKTTSVYTYKNQHNNDKYALQGSIYRWLDPKIITQNTMEIHYIFTDWKPSMVKTDPNYPPKRFHTQSFNLHTQQEITKYVTDKLALIEKYIDSPEADIPYCDDADLWRSEPVYKYYKNGDTTSRRSTKNFPTMQEAIIYMANNGNTGAVKEVPGSVTACKYCPAFAICSQKDQLISSGDLVME